jgi:hypothetical protein
VQDCPLKGFGLNGVESSQFAASVVIGFKMLAQI